MRTFNSSAEQYLYNKRRNRARGGLFGPSYQQPMQQQPVQQGYQTRTAAPPSLQHGSYAPTYDAGPNPMGVDDVFQHSPSYDEMRPNIKPNYRQPPLPPVSISDQMGEIYRDMTPEEQAVIDARNARIQQQNENINDIYGRMESNSANIRNLRRGIYGAPLDGPISGGYAPPMSNNGSRVVDYMGPVTGDQVLDTGFTKEARDAGATALYEQRAREAAMLDSTGLGSRMQALRGGAPVRPATRTDGTVMVTDASGRGRYQTVANGAYNPNTGQIEGTYDNPVDNTGIANFTPSGNARRSFEAYQRAVERNPERVARSRTRGQRERARQMARSGLISREAAAAYSRGDISDPMDFNSRGMAASASPAPEGTMAGPGSYENFRGDIPEGTEASQSELMRRSQFKDRWNSFVEESDYSDAAVDEAARSLSLDEINDLDPKVMFPPLDTDMPKYNKQISFWEKARKKRKEMESNKS